MCKFENAAKRPKHVPQSSYSILRSEHVASQRGGVSSFAGGSGLGDPRAVHVDLCRYGVRGLSNDYQIAPSAKVLGARCN